MGMKKLAMLTLPVSRTHYKIVCVTWHLDRIHEGCFKRCQHRISPQQLVKKKLKGGKGCERLWLRYSLHVVC